MALPPLLGLELFSGVGMLGEGLRAGLDYLGLPYRTVCHIEREAFAAGDLAARMAEKSLDDAPIWSDVVTFDARRWRGRVDCVVAGFPCQDLSVAGKRAGLDGARSGLFFEVVRIADDCGARLLFLENVAGIASAAATVMDAAEGDLEERAAARVLGELADRGWDAEWLTLSASDVGASHGRARWFCLAWRDLADAGLQYLILQQRPDGAEYPGNGTPVADATRPVRDGAKDGQGGGRRRVCETGDELGDTLGNRRRERRAELSRRTGRFDLGGKGVPVADAGQPGQQGRELGVALSDDGRRAETHGSVGEFCGLFAPGPNDPRWPGILAATPWLAPALSIEEEHDAALAFAAAQSLLRRVADGLADGLDFTHRSARLRCCGNGVVAAQAAVAVVELLRRAGIL